VVISFSVSRFTGRRREDSGLSGYATHAAGGWIVHRAAQKVVEVGIRLGCAFIVMLCGSGWFDPREAAPGSVVAGDVFRSVVKDRCCAQMPDLAARLRKGQIARVRHLQRGKDVLLRVDIQRLAA
jgi:hypothetical protein